MVADLGLDEGLKRELLRRSHGSTRRVCVNLAQVHERAQVLGRDHMSTADFDAGSFFTGTAPSPRRDLAGLA